jgi:hypothetical protein
MMGLRVFGGGLMIISKYPIETTRELVFDKGVASDGFVTKGILYAKVKIGSSYVHVCFPFLVLLIYLYHT